MAAIGAAGGGQRPRLPRRVPKAIPYGIYDVGADTGFVTVGVDHDTAQFAANAIGTWWDLVGRGRYPHARRVLVTADCESAHGGLDSLDGQFRRWHAHNGPAPRRPGAAAWLGLLPFEPRCPVHHRDVDYGSGVECDVPGGEGAATGRSRVVAPGWRRRVSLPPLVTDTAIAAGGATITVWISSAYEVEGARPWDAFAFGLTILVTAPLAVRRLWPVPVLAASCMFLVWFFTAGYVPSFIVFGPLLAAYTVAQSRPIAISVAGAALTAATLSYGGTRYGFAIGPAVAESVLLTAVVAMFGANARRLADRNRRLADLTEQLSREREERARLAVTQERIRIARELHDVVAHHMSVVSVQAGMARYVLQSDPQTTGVALDTIADTSRDALEELRRILSLLRTEDSDVDGDLEDTRHPAPGLTRLDDLVARVRRAGVPVELVASGRIRSLPPGIDLCAYRVIQESLTNVIKHARPASATVVVNYGDATLAVTVSDDGRGPALGTGGHGVVGMRERARLYGGSLTAEPRPECGFEVKLTLPLQGYRARPLPGTTRPDS